MARPTISDARTYKIPMDITNPTLYVFKNRKVHFFLTPYKPEGGTVVLDVKINNTSISYILEANKGIEKTFTCKNSSENILKRWNKEQR